MRANGGDYLSYNEIYHNSHPIHRLRRSNALAVQQRHENSPAEPLDGRRRVSLETPPIAPSRPEEDYHYSINAPAWSSPQQNEEARVARENIKYPERRPRQTPIYEQEIAAVERSHNIAVERDKWRNGLLQPFEGQSLSQSREYRKQKTEKSQQIQTPTVFEPEEYGHIGGLPSHPPRQTPTWEETVPVARPRVPPADPHHEEDLLHNRSLMAYRRRQQLMLDMNAETNTMKPNTHTAAKPEQEFVLAVAPSTSKAALKHASRQSTIKANQYQDTSPFLNEQMVQPVVEHPHVHDDFSNAPALIDVATSPIVPEEPPIVIPDRRQPQARDPVASRLVFDSATSPMPANPRAQHQPPVTSTTSASAFTRQPAVASQQFGAQIERPPLVPPTLSNTPKGAVINAIMTHTATDAQAPRCESVECTPWEDTLRKGSSGAPSPYHVTQVLSPPKEGPPGPQFTPKPATPQTENTPATSYRHHDVSLASPNPNRNRFYSRGTWEPVASLMIPAPVTCVAEAQGSMPMPLHEDISGEKSSPLRDSPTRGVTNGWMMGEFHFALGHINGVVTIVECRLLGRTGSMSPLRAVRCFTTLHPNCRITALMLNNGQLISGGTDGLIRRVDVARSSVVSTFHLPRQSPTALHADGQILAVGTAEGDIFCFSLSQEIEDDSRPVYRAGSTPLLCQCRGHLSGEIIAINVEAMSGCIAACDAREVIITNIATPDVAHTVFRLPAPILLQCHFCPDRWLLVTHNGYAMTIGKCLYMPRRDRSGYVPLDKSLVLFDDVRDIAASAVSIKHTVTLNEAITHPTKAVPGAEISLTGTVTLSSQVIGQDRLMTAESDGTIRVWGWTPQQHYVEGNPPNQLTSAETEHRYSSGGAQRSTASASGQRASPLEHVADVSLNIRGRRALRRVHVFFDRFVLLTDDVSVELFNCGAPFYPTK